MQNPVIPGEFMAMHPEFLLPADQLRAWEALRTGAIVGRKTAVRFGWKIGDKVPIQSTIWSKKDGSFIWDFDIVGIFDGRNKNTDTTALFFHYDYFDEARSFWTGQVGWYTVRIDDSARAADVAKLIDAEFENSSAETKSEPEGAFVQGWAKQIGDIALITASILGAVFFTILLVTGNTISQSVRERTGELGVLKAIGFTNTHVLVLVMAESCLIAVIGGVLGLSLAWLLTSRGDPTGGMLPLYFFPVRDMLLGLAISVALGLVTGCFPALQAMRLRVADSLRRI
jgi:putative ABC transport system permease protein